MSAFPHIRLPSLKMPSVKVDISLPKMPKMPKMPKIPKLRLDIGGISMKIKLFLGFTQCISFFPITFASVLSAASLFSPGDTIVTYPHGVAVGVVSETVLQSYDGLGFVKNASACAARATGGSLSTGQWPYIPYGCTMKNGQAYLPTRVWPVRARILSSAMSFEARANLARTLVIALLFLGHRQHPGRRAHGRVPGCDYAQR